MIKYNNELYEIKPLVWRFEHSDSSYRASTGPHHLKITYTIGGPYILEIDGWIKTGVDSLAEAKKLADDWVRRKILDFLQLIEGDYNA